MHYKNGREAKNGDKVVMLSAYGAPFVGILYDATPGNDLCNGMLAPLSTAPSYANLSECLHIDDVRAALDKAPECQKPVPSVPDAAAEVPADQVAPIAEGGTLVTHGKDKNGKDCDLLDLNRPGEHRCTCGARPDFPAVFYQAHERPAAKKIEKHRYPTSPLKELPMSQATKDEAAEEPEQRAPGDVPTCEGKDGKECGKKLYRFHKNGFMQCFECRTGQVYKPTGKRRKAEEAAKAAPLDPSALTNEDLVRCVAEAQRRLDLFSKAFFPKMAE